jgi:hypothetical protein
VFFFFAFFLLFVFNGALFLVSIFGRGDWNGSRLPVFGGYGDKRPYPD